MRCCLPWIPWRWMSWIGILEELRRKRGLPSLDKVDLTADAYSDSAKMGLGVGERAAIDVVSSRFDHELLPS